MVQDEVDPLDADAAGVNGPAAARRRVPARFWRQALALTGLALAVLLAAVWLGREKIADNLIESQLAGLGLPVTYEIASIGPRRQILRNVVVGDPRRPDLTIAQVSVSLVPRLGTPGIGRIILTRPRLYGTYRDGTLSFGSLDKVLFTGSKQPFRMPDLELAMDDGRALLETGGGPVGIKLAGAGALRGGFRGEIAAIAPNYAQGGCRAEQATLYGAVRIEAEKPRFTGPLRLARLRCGADGADIRGIAAQIDARFDKPLDGVDARVGLRSGRLAFAGGSMGGFGGSGRLVWRKAALTAHYDLSGTGVSTPQARLAAIGAEGVVRAVDGFARLDVDGTLQAGGIAAGDGLDRALAGLAVSAKDTLAEPLAAKLRAALAREARGSSLNGQYLLRRTGSVTSLTVPQAFLRGGSGDTLLAVSRFQLMQGAAGLPRLSGNVSTGGTNMPRLSGRMERSGSGGLQMRLTLAEYAAGSARIAIPELRVAQTRGGALGFAGEARVSGDLPGGRAENLSAAFDGNWSSARGLTFWRKCAPLRFDRLEFASLALDGRAVTLCPPRGSAIVASGRAGLRIAAGVPALSLSGRLGTTPIRLTTGPIGFAVPGTLAARALSVELGPPGTASHFRVAGLSARIGKDIAGRFDGADVLLDAVPLDIRDASGDWRLAGGRLDIADAAFRVEDRAEVRRFEPLVSQDGALDLADSRIVASASLLEPSSRREVLRTAIVHDLASGAGSADLFVDNLVFDDQLQPDTLTFLALGVIANARGTVRGKGRIDWNAETVTSSGSFSTDSLDFAAAFGPVDGASGTIHFTDLLGLVTAPDQKLTLAAMNPGIEVTDGEIVYELRPGSQLAIKGGNWPFLGGTLALKPAVMNMGVAEDRRYVLSIRGLDSARLLAQMDLANLSMSGIFDGDIPLLFDKDGGHLESGFLQSRQPGGNISYVGELTYKDLSPMANFAFGTLRSLDYRSMSVQLDGSLEGEIITKLNFDGIRQGKGASQNFLTRRIARLPIRFVVNIRAPFFQLVSSLRSMYDPAYVRDPRSLGLIDDAGKPLASPAGAPPSPPERPAPAGPVIQPPESETMP